MKGKIDIVKEYYVCCVNCYNDNIYHGWKKKIAEQSFRDDGWSTRKGRWICPSCLKTRRMRDVR